MYVRFAVDTVIWALTMACYAQAGFFAGQASCDEGSCAAGLDVPSCEEQLSRRLDCGR